MEDTLLEGVYSIQGRIPCSMEYTQYRGVSPSQGGILNTVEETLLQGVYSIQGRGEDTLLQGHTNSILTRGGILNTVEETLLQGVY